MSEANDIFQPGHGDKSLTEDRLMAYLEGKLSPAEQHEVEMWLAEEGMESDAMEGLKNIDTHEAKTSIKKINYNLHKSITNKKRTRRPLHADQFTWIAIAIILLLAVIAYIVIRKSV